MSENIQESIQSNIGFIQSYGVAAPQRQPHWSLEQYLAVLIQEAGRIESLFEFG